MDFIMSTLDYYEILGVDKGASTTTLKSAYRKMAMKHHPDQNPNDPTAEDRFKKINEAWEVLKDPQKKSTYDRKYTFSYTQNPRNRSYVKGQNFYDEAKIRLEDAFKGGIIEMDVPHTSERIIKVRVPAGVNDGDYLIVTGYGEQILNGTNGDLHIDFIVQESNKSFTRVRNDIHTTLRVKLKAGQKKIGKVQIPTIDGNKVEINIPKNTPSGTKFRLHGRGMSIKYSSQRGDMIVKVVIIKSDTTKEPTKLFDKIKSVWKSLLN